MGLCEGFEMVGPVEIGGAISGLKSLLDIAKSLKSINDEVMLNNIKIAMQSAVLEAQGGLLAAQESQTENVKLIAELQKQIAQLKDWSTEKQKYELTRYEPGSFAYSLKSNVEGSEPTHMLCVNCFNNDTKSILQATHRTPQRYRVHLCPACKSEFEIGDRSHGPKLHQEIPNKTSHDPYSEETWKTL